MLYSLWDVRLYLSSCVPRLSHKPPSLAPQKRSRPEA